MKNPQCVEFLQWALPELGLRWPGFRKVRGQVCKRLNRRMLVLGLDDFAAYREYLQKHAEEWPRLDAMCRISISRFYRDRGEFDLIRSYVLPELAVRAREHKHSTVRIWSAGCASGEEPYTVRIICDLAITREFPDINFEIIATDADEHMLARARTARYPESSLKDFPREWTDAAFTQNGGDVMVADRFRNSIDWRQQDIREARPDGPFDLILCRHLVFTYFDEPLQTTILKGLLERLRPAGALMTGKQEELPETLRVMLTKLSDNSGIYLPKTD